MREKIEQEIIDWLKSGNENTTYIAERILLLFSVSGNEANQPENKKDGEVTLTFEQRQCPVCKININVEDNYCSGCGQKFKWQ